MNVFFCSNHALVPAPWPGYFFFFSLKTKQKILYTPLAVIAKWKGIDMYLDLQNFIYMQYFTGSSSRDNCTSE